MGIMRKTLLLAFILNLLVLPVRAIISTDRGGVSNSNGIVPGDKIQLEYGFMTYRKNFGARDNYRYDLASILIRKGIITDRLEIRAFNSGLALANFGGDEEYGFDNLTLGTKLEFFDERGLRPALDLISNFQIPLGHKGLSNPGFSHNYNFIASHKFLEKWAWLINFGPSFVSQERSNDREFTSVELPYVLNIGYDLSNKLNVFGEVFGNWILTSDFENQVGLSSGFKYSIKENLILDFSTIYGLNSATDDLNFNFGINYRI